ncbi:MAG: phosphoglucomutase/phosphomannomutase family protein [Acidobacteriaceae bacterium]|jgi:phosphomannomutase|nr:phosphoglucomutase/phosphomannomutase family protein [Acidobacteriaceae bacterium]
MTAKKTVVKFGTDGWRGVIADDFTYENVRTASAAIAHYVLEVEDGAHKGVCIAYDTRFGSKRFAALVAEVLAGAGVPVFFADRITSTPALSYDVLHRKAAGGVMITSSHNPANWNGVKYKASYGGAGKPSIIAAIETYLEKPLPKAETPAKITEVDFHPDYLEAIKKFVDLKLIAASGYKFLIDPMYGTGSGVIKKIFEDVGVPCVEIRGEQNPLFPGINPEPIMPHIQATRDAVVANKCDAGLITDGDADRIGAVDEHGNVVTSHMIFAVMLNWLLERKKWPGDVTRAFNTTLMLDRIAMKHGRKLHEHGIGFKYVTDLILEHDILIGGEESGGIGIARHLPERDGLLNSLVLANVMAEEKKTLGQLVAALQDEFGVHEYGRVDMHITEEVKQGAIARAKAGVAEFAGMKVLRVETLDGIKFFLDNPGGKKNPKTAETWLLLRASGTEPLLRVYCEGPSKETVAKVLEAAQAFVLGGTKA